MKNIEKIFHYSDYKGRLHRLYKNEKGSALLIAMIMLVVLLIIGTATMNTSTTEVMISGNYRLMKEEFYKTEGPLEYAQSQANIYSTIGTTVGNSTAIPLAADNTNSAVLNKNVFSDVAAGSNVVLRRIGNAPPRSSGTQAMKFKSLHYVIDVTGRGPANAESHQIMEVVRYLPEG